MLPPVEIKKRVLTVRGMLENARTDFERALPKHFPVEKMMGLALTALRDNPKLLEADPVSLLGALMQASRLGLSPDGLLGEAYLLPFGKKVTLIPGYRGLLNLARQSGNITSIYAHEVCENDTFSYAYGLEDELIHRPLLTGDRGEVIAFYAVAILKDGGHLFEVMSKAEVDAVRDKSQGYLSAKRYSKTHPWMEHYIAMGRKTVLRRLCKYLPLSTEAHEAVYVDQAVDRGEIPTRQADYESTIRPDLNVIIEQEPGPQEQQADPRGPQKQQGPEEQQGPDGQADLNFDL